jgi:hypothetical protein
VPTARCCGDHTRGARALATLAPAVLCDLMLLLSWRKGFTRSPRIRETRRLSRDEMPHLTASTSWGGAAPRTCRDC